MCDYLEVRNHVGTEHVQRTGGRTDKAPIAHARICPRNASELFILIFRIYLNCYRALRRRSYVASFWKDFVPVHTVTLMTEYDQQRPKTRQSDASVHHEERSVVLARTCRDGCLMVIQRVNSSFGFAICSRGGSMRLR